MTISNCLIPRQNLISVSLWTNEQKLLVTRRVLTDFKRNKNTNLPASRQGHKTFILGNKKCFLRFQYIILFCLWMLHDFKSRPISQHRTYAACKCVCVCVRVCVCECHALDLQGKIITETQKQRAGC